jgi:hypothetical protein
MIDYDVDETAKKVDLKRLLKPLLAAEQAMARTDERLRVLPFRNGAIERIVYHEACAVSLLEGKLVPVEDLVQFEAGVLQKISYPELSACHGTYAILRHAWRTAPETLLAGASPGDGLERHTLSEGKRNEFILRSGSGRDRKTGGLAERAAGGRCLAGASGRCLCLGRLEYTAA